MRSLFPTLFRRFLLIGLLALVSPLSLLAAGPQLGLQCWTFRRYTLQETLDHAVSLNIPALQAYVGQALGGGLSGTFGPQMSPEEITAVQSWLRSRGVALVSMGVVKGNDEESWRQLIALAKALGIQNITTEVNQTLLPMVARLTGEAGLTLSLHNHPQPTRYADPQVALAAIKDLPGHVGICADTGHWTRDGRDPVATLRLVGPRLRELHFKDVSEPRKSAHDMPWGTGIGDAAAQIAELRRQGFTGYAFVEYEHDTAHLFDEVARSVAFFRLALRAPLEDLETGRLVPPGYSREVSALSRNKWASSPGRWPSPKPLFAPDLSNAEMAEGAWVWEEGVLVSKNKGDLWTKESYGDFSLSLEFRCVEKTNSGVFLRTSDVVNWLHNAIEVQINQVEETEPKHNVGALFDVQAPGRNLPIEPGQWYRCLIIARGPSVEVYINGEPVVKADLNQWTTAGQNPDGTPNKFSKAYRDMAREGRIGLQDHGTPIAFRNLLIERL